ncbi:hypothetical protein D9758_013653 [Tetrapyrgos nigripes]|uniref:Uncharacterized protein n=1 Tax=Tetrapyrgos nigripes TaxID=182062 RepID=A0A8H5CQZ8_9AGAR|nr:hypothetical protein D9758_013653 [Tetrapyrgos nigripes]
MYPSPSTSQYGDKDRPPTPFSHPRQTQNTHSSIVYEIVGDMSASVFAFVMLTVLPFYLASVFPNSPPSSNRQNCNPPSSRRPKLRCSHPTYHLLPRQQRNRHTSLRNALTPNPNPSQPRLSVLHESQTQYFQHSRPPHPHPHPYSRYQPSRVNNDSQPWHYLGIDIAVGDIAGS